MSTGEHTFTFSVGNSPRITLACAYWCPSVPVAGQLEELSSAINHAGNGYFMAMGDFNCRIGNHHIALDDILPLHNILAATRSTLDVPTNSRGSLLCDLTDQEGLIVLNGRTLSDPDGDFTFVSHVGRSLVDLVICNIQLASLILDGGVLSWPSSSDHFPIFARVGRLNHCDAAAVPPPLVKEPFLKWDQSLRIH